MTMKLSYITFSIFFSTLMYAECGNYDFEECLIRIQLTCKGEGGGGGGRRLGRGFWKNIIYSKCRRKG